MNTFLSASFLVFLTSANTITRVHAGFYSIPPGRHNRDITMVKRTADGALKDDDVEHVPTSREFVPRYAGPSENEMTDVQKEIRDAIVKSRPRTGLSGVRACFQSLSEKLAVVVMYATTSQLYQNHLNV